MEPMLIGPLGNLIEVRTPVAMPVSVERPATSLTLANGQKINYRTPRRSREWHWEIPYATDDEIDNLLALEAGAFGPGPWRWYDPMAAVTNMLPDVVAAAGIGPMPWRWVANSPAVVRVSGPMTIGDRQLANCIVPLSTLRLPVRNGEVDPVPVIPGRTYTASVYVGGGDGQLSLEWIGPEGNRIGSIDSPFSTGRLSATGEAPAEAVGATLRIETGVVSQALQVPTTGHGFSPYVEELNTTGVDARVTFAVEGVNSDVHRALVSRYQLDDDRRQWSFRINIDRQLHFQWSYDGITLETMVSTDSIPLSPGEMVTARVVFTPDTGLNTYSTQFYFGQGENLSLFDNISRPGTTMIHQGEANLEIGSNADGANPLNGDIYRVEVRDGLNGPIVANPDFTADGWQIGDNSSTPARTDSVGREISLIGDAEIQRRVLNTSSVRVGGFQLTETDEVVPWRNGMGMPRVSLGLTENAYQRLTNYEKYRNVSMTLTEVV